MVQNLANHLRLMLVTDDLLLGERDPVAVCRAAERGGVDRGPAPTQAGLATGSARPGPAASADTWVPVIVNDRPDVARACRMLAASGPR